MITDVPGVRAGHWMDERGQTGCTAILFPESRDPGAAWIRNSSHGPKPPRLALTIVPPPFSATTYRLCALRRPMPSPSFTVPAPARRSRVNVSQPPGLVDRASSCPPGYAIR